MTTTTTTVVDDDVKRHRLLRVLAGGSVTSGKSHAFDDDAAREAERLARATVGGPDASQHTAARRPGSPARIPDGKF